MIFQPCQRRWHVLRMLSGTFNQVPLTFNPQNHVTSKTSLYQPSLNTLDHSFLSYAPDQQTKNKQTDKQRDSPECSTHANSVSWHE